jgi:hypothetical protein
LPGPDPSHWLHRLTAEEWLAAAETELEQCAAALARRAVRPGVTHARRAAGMALNGLMVLEEHPTWARSYMEHVVALADEALAPEEVRAAARLLRDTPPAPPALISLGRPDLRALEAASQIRTWARERVGALQGPAA